MIELYDSQSILHGHNWDCHEDIWNENSILKMAKIQQSTRYESGRNGTLVTLTLTQVKAKMTDNLDF